MMKIIISAVAIAILSLIGCSEQVADPQALYDHYMKNDADRNKKLHECRLMSAAQNASNQACTIAQKAEQDLALSKTGGLNLDPKGMKLKIPGENKK